MSRPVQYPKYIIFIKLWKVNLKNKILPEWNSKLLISLSSTCVCDVKFRDIKQDYWSFEFGKDYNYF